MWSGHLIRNLFHICRPGHPIDTSISSWMSLNGIQCCRQCTAREQFFIDVIRINFVRMPNDWKQIYFFAMDLDIYTILLQSIDGNANGELQHIKMLNETFLFPQLLAAACEYTFAQCLGISFALLRSRFWVHTTMSMNGWNLFVSSGVSRSRRANVYALNRSRVIGADKWTSGAWGKTEIMKLDRVVFFDKW